MANKELDLFKELIPAIDMGFKELYDAAGEDGKKDIKGDLWNLNRWISSIKGNYEKQALAIFRVNEYYNKNWNEIGSKDHNNLQWKLLCAAGATGKKEFHPWIKLERKKDSDNKFVQVLAKIYPNMKWDEVETLAKLSSKKEIIQLAEEHGFENEFK